MGMDEEGGEKGSRKDRWKVALSRTKTRLREHSKKGDKDEFKLSDDVNEFLQAGRLSTSDSGAGRSDTPPDKLLYPQVDHARMVQAGLANPPQRESSNVMPPRQISPAQRSPRGIPIPKIDVTRSQRWPGQQELGNLRAQQIDDFLRPTEHPDQHARSQSQGATPDRRKGPRPRNLSVAFLEAPPVVIGEGGDEAKEPPREIGRAKARARSVSPMPGRILEGYSQQIRRKQVFPGASFAGSVSKSQYHSEPQRLAKIQTGLQYPTSAGSKSSAEMAEFEMSLQAPTPVTPAREQPPIRSPQTGMPSAQPNETPPPPPTDGPPETETAQFAQETYGERHLRPAVANQDLRMQYEEGQALRHSHYRSLSNSSIIDTDVSPVSPDLGQLPLRDTDKRQEVVSERPVESNVSPVSPEELPGGWI